MNWGNKILVTFIAFVLLIGTLVYKSVTQKVELVSADYYNDELKFQEKIDGNENANKFSNVEVYQNAEEVNIQLPKELKGLAVEGEAWFYCPENSDNDRKIPMQVSEEGIMRIDKTKLVKTNYQVKLSWRHGNEKFYNEQKILVK
ncbi:MAG: FixH family protein [Chitinophagaceae bacterium]